jgi:CDP-paratose 2-epimerase
VLEAIELCQRLAERELRWQLADSARVGDHRWWISDVADFGSAYGWRPRRSLETILREIHDANAERWAALPA